jgi:hypothetical protein
MLSEIFPGSKPAPGFESSGEERANEEFRQRFQRSAQTEFPLGTHAIDTERLWRRIQMAQASAGAARASWRLPQLPLPLIGTLAAAALLFLVVNLNQVGQNEATTTVPGTTLKGDPTGVAFKLSSLRFAVVSPEGELKMGHSGMTIRPGTALVFAVEAHGIDLQKAQAVTLSYTQEGQKARVLVDSYTLRKERDVMSGPHGYYSFAPQQAGRYTFTLKALPSAEKVEPRHEEDSSQSVSFEILVPAR